MRTTLIAGIILAAASGSALAQGVGTPPKPAVAAKPPVVAKPPQAAVKPASTPESRSAAALALSSDPVFDEGTFQRIKEALLFYSDIQVRGGWPMLPADAKLEPGERSRKGARNKIEIRISRGPITPQEAVWCDGGRQVWLACEFSWYVGPRRDTSVSEISGSCLPAKGL